MYIQLRRYLQASFVRMGTSLWSKREQDCDQIDSTADGGSEWYSILLSKFKFPN